MLHAVIMAGGSGTRFWPASRQAFPKQLLALGTTRPLVEETVDRIAPLIPPERILVVTNSRYARMTAELLPEIPEENIIGEPVGRDTAACIGLAAMVLSERDPEAVMVVMPADHLITPPERFCMTIQAAAEVVEERRERLVTFGVTPTFPATGYGYIKRSDAVTQARTIDFFGVNSFLEKPNLEQAMGFLKEGGYYWNAGIFIWKAKTILENLARHLPQLHQGLLEVRPAVDGPDFDAALAKVYPGLEKISIDYGVMEKAEGGLVAAVSYE